MGPRLERLVRQRCAAVPKRASERCEAARRVHSGERPQALGAEEAASLVRLTIGLLPRPPRLMTNGTSESQGVTSNYVDVEGSERAA